MFLFIELLQESYKIIVLAERSGYACSAWYSCILAGIFKSPIFKLLWVSSTSKAMGLILFEPFSYTVYYTTPPPCLFIYLE